MKYDYRSKNNVVLTAYSKTTTACSDKYRQHLKKDLSNAKVIILCGVHGTSTEKYFEAGRLWAIISWEYPKIVKE